MAVGEPSRSRCAFGETDGGEGQALALRFSSETNPANLANLVNPAHILQILKILLFNLTKIKK